LLRTVVADVSEGRELELSVLTMQLSTAPISTPYAAPKRIEMYMDPGKMNAWTLCDAVVSIRAQIRADIASGIL
jgi:hypothetical protein